MHRNARRTFTPKSFARHLPVALGALPALARAYLRPVATPALREKVMLATTRVNDCRYCAWIHGAMARHHGVDLDQLQEQLVAGGVACDDRCEAAAIVYAQRYAATDGDPDPAITAALFAACGDRLARELRVYVESIHFANLSGNTLDAVLARVGLRT